jgi:AraC-like DNA-binding protein
MRQELLDELRKITPEEQKILDGRDTIDKDIYMSKTENIVDASKLLEKGKLIQVRPHTRFVHFPKHTHNYIEVIYMCEGKTHHVIDGIDVMLKAGELLFLNQKAVQEIYPASKHDIAINFIILPEFFDHALSMMGDEKNLLRDFVIDCLRSENASSSYIHFKVAGIIPIQNLVENMIWTIWNRQPNKRSINQITMGLLFLQLMNNIDLMATNTENSRQKLTIDVLKYVEEHYRDGELSQLSQLLHCDMYWLSKEIKKLTGCNYTELVQKKRLSQAAYLLKNTSLSVMDIAMSVGYENMSYFHRIFQKEYGITPRHYRITN